MEQPIIWTLQDIVNATGAKVLVGSPDSIFESIAIDSRSINKKALFIAITGASHDGHQFAESALEKGAGGVIIAESMKSELPVEKWHKASIPCFMVPDTTLALGALGRFQRLRSKVRVVAITGSNGKTTTRSMAAAVAAQSFDTLATCGNLNNEIGLPLTLLRLSSRHECAIVELGMNHIGEISRLGAICEPEAGLITNIGLAHIEGLGSIQDIAKAKGELLPKIRPGGTAIMNADDSRVMQLAKACTAKVLLYGMSTKGHIRAEKVRLEDNGLLFRLILPGEQIDVRLNKPGAFMVSNALAAAAIGFWLKIPAEKIKFGLEHFALPHGRMDLKRLKSGVNVIDDTYNANPGSMLAALETLKSLSGHQRKIFAAGDMLELGQESQKLHCKLGRAACRTGIDRLYLCGAMADTVAASAREAGMARGAIFVGSQKEIIADLCAFLYRGDWLLVKGSRGMAMENIVKGLLQLSP